MWPLRRRTPDSGDPWLVVGLGNPGDRYSQTPHNAGARAVERMTEQLQVQLKPTRQRALVADARQGDNRLLLARPTTYMNESGHAVSALLRYHKLTPDHLIVVHDDLDLKPGVMRIKKGGGSGGQHGIESIVSVIGTKDFYRIRIGVGRPRSPQQDPADYLLGKMPKDVAEQVSVTEAETGDAVQVLINEGLDRAMSLFNTR